MRLIRTAGELSKIPVPFLYAEVDGGGGCSDLRLVVGYLGDDEVFGPIECELAVLRTEQGEGDYDALMRLERDGTIANDPFCPSRSHLLSKDGPWVVFDETDIAGMIQMLEAARSAERVAPHQDGKGRSARWAD